MHKDMNFGIKRPLNISLVLVALLLAWIKVANSQETITTWYSSNITVTRNLVLQDYFDFWSSTGKQECLNLSRTICEDHGGTQAESNCKELCCRRCVCAKDKPTFVSQKQQCVEDRNITGVLGSYQLVLNLAGTSCANNTRLPTLDVSEKQGKQSFIICSNGVQISLTEVVQCSLDQYITVEGWNGSEAKMSAKKSFQITKNVRQLQLKWLTGIQSLQGHIVSIPVKCDMERFISMREPNQQYIVQSSLYFKVPGEQSGPGPKVFYHVTPVSTAPTLVSSTNASGSVVMTTPSGFSTTEYKSKLNVVHVTGKVDLLLVILAAILGSLLFIVIGSAIIAFFVVFRRKKKLSISGKHSTSNPTYERGPDQSLINGGSHQSSLYKVSSSFYQPLVENTRMLPRNGKDPIYESLDDNLRQSKASLTENPNRCSLAYCDITSDGYLIPTGDEHTPPDPPPSLPIIPENGKQNHSRPRLSSSYDEPEVVILDRKPKQTVQECDKNELKSPDEDKQTYQVLEEDAEEGNSKECVNTEHQDNEHQNEDASDIYKNATPTENSYLELIGDEETQHPLESEIL